MTCTETRACRTAHRPDLIAAGLCPYGCGRLEPVTLHGEPYQGCRPCGVSWRSDGADVWAVACVPWAHTCGRRRLTIDTTPHLDGLTTGCIR